MHACARDRTNAFKTRPNQCIPQYCLNQRREQKGKNQIDSAKLTHSSFCLAAEAASECCAVAFIARAANGKRNVSTHFEYDARFHEADRPAA